MESSIIHTRYCGTLKLEVSYQGPLESRPKWAYSIMARFGNTPLSYTSFVEIPITDVNPQGEEALTTACNEFINHFQRILSQTTTPREEDAKTPVISVLMDAPVVNNIFNALLCQNVEGMLQANQPMWLITDREV